MKPEIKSISVITSGDHLSIVNFNFSQPIPYLDIEIEAGIPKTNGADIFFCSFYTEDYIIQQAIDDKWVPNEGKGAVYCKNITKEFVLNHINSIVENVEGENWAEVAEKLNKHFGWEFENYQEWQEPTTEQKPKTH